MIQCSYRNPGFTRSRNSSGRLCCIRILFCIFLITPTGSALFTFPAFAQQEEASENDSDAYSIAPLTQGRGADPASPTEFHKAWFPYQGLNVGLDETSSIINRATPRATLESFLSLTENGDYQSAAHLLDLALIPPQNQKDQGPELARKLNEIFFPARLVELD